MATFRRSLIAVVVLTVVFGLVYPLVFTGFAQLAFSDRANGSLIEHDGKVVGSPPRRPGVHARRLLPPAPVRHRSGLQRRRHDLLQPRPDEPRPGEARRRACPRDPRARRPLHGRARGRRHPRRRGHHVRLRDRSTDLARVRAPADAPRRRGARPLRGARRRAGRRQHGRPLPGLPRRAGRQRARAQPCTR